MPVSDGIQDYLESIENYIYVSFSARAEIPNIQEALNRLCADVSRFGPAMPEICFPVLIEVPPPPPGSNRLGEGLHLSRTIAFTNPLANPISGRRDCRQVTWAP
jgi:hypothetical protein